jgi:hypothetical protein
MRNVTTALDVKRRLREVADVLKTHDEIFEVLRGQMEHGTQNERDIAVCHYFSLVGVTQQVLGSYHEEVRSYLKEGDQ